MKHWLLLLVFLLVTLACDSSGMLSPPLTAAPEPVEARSDDAVRLTTPPSGASDQNPAFSPDGSRLVFTRFDNGYNDGPAGLFLLNMSSGQATRLTPIEDQDNVNLPGAAWDGVNERIIFSSDRADADDLWRIAPDGGDLSRITAHSDPSWYFEPSWSPDGEWIVFEISQPDDGKDGRSGQIWKVRANGSDLTALTDGMNDDRQPNWSPAGDWILFQRWKPPDGPWDIYTIAPDGGELHNITTSDADDTDASWSPDGSWIVYSSHSGELSTPNIFIIPIEGGAPIRVTHDDVYADTAPSWSPDGEWIVFESHLGQEKDAPASLWCIAAPSLSHLPAVSGSHASQPSASRQTLARTLELTASICLPLVINNLSPLNQVNDFLYQLQNLDLTAVGETAYDLVVIDYAAHGDEATEFTAAQIETLKHSPGGEKIVLAYMSVGEAEEYRFYWQSSWEPGNPTWLDEENPDWEGNYKVRYWNPGWQAIIFDYTDRLLDAGFDGAYLDLVDVYEYYVDQRSTAAQDMADFVAAIRAHAHAYDPGFYIFVQNGIDLVEEAPAYLDSVDGIGHEGVYYGYEEEDVMTPPAATGWMETYLDMFKDDGKLVLTVDYATSLSHVDDAYAKSQAKGYIPFCTVCDLDQLIINPGHEPD